MEIPYTVSPRRDTGLYNAKIGMWLFLASEVMLFGGLFSGYVFLRAGAREGVDLPWPNGIDVHGKFIWIGFTNTIVLILSSVFVVMAWLQLKLRNYAAYQRYLAGVLLCAAIFMGFKTVEYRSKLNDHFGVRLVDGTVLDGSLGYDEKHQCPGDSITFAATGAEFSLEPVGILRKSDPYFLSFAREGTRKVKLQTMEAREEERVLGTADGGEVVKVTSLQFVAAPGEGREVALSEVGATLDAERKRYGALAAEHFARTRKALKAALKSATSSEARELLHRELAVLRPAAVPARLNGVWEDPAIFQFRRRNVLHGRLFETSVPFFGGNMLKGELVDDSIELVVHDVDLQMVRDVEKSLAWTYLGDGYRKGFDHFQDGVLEQHQKWIGKGGTIPRDMLLLWKNAHPMGAKGEHGGEMAGASSGSGGHAAAEVSIAGKDIRFSGSHGPRFGPYYAIYFTMTALHGLHVVGGALVLGYFLFFGRKIYRRNPEHLANRVEVGGLFWHFVDLIWIFLFPIMYLL